jgi:hypothetical protein
MKRDQHSFLWPLPAERFLAPLTLALLVGCAVGPDYHRPDAVANMPAGRERAVARLHGLQYIATVALVKALGGGWEGLQHGQADNSTVANQRQIIQPIHNQENQNNEHTSSMQLQSGAETHLPLLGGIGRGRSH